MRTLFHWVLPAAVLVIVSSGCAATHKPAGMLDALSARRVKPSEAAPTTQLASHQTPAIQPSEGGRPTAYPGVARTQAPKRFQLPKCLTGS